MKRKRLHFDDWLKGQVKNPKFKKAYDKEWQDLLKYGRRKAKAAGIRTEKDVERLIDEGRA